MTLQVKGHISQKPAPLDSPWMSSVPQPPPCQRGEMPSYRRAWLQPRLITRPPGVSWSHVGQGGQTNQTTRRMKAPFGWKQSCFLQKSSLDFRTVRGCFEILCVPVFYHSAWLALMLYWAIFKHYTSVLPDSGVGGSSLQALMDAEGREGLELRRARELGTSVPVRTPIAPRSWHSAPSSVPYPVASPSERQSTQWLGTWPHSLTQATYGECLGMVFSLSVPWFPYPTCFMGQL